MAREERPEDGRSRRRSRGGEPADVSREETGWLDDLRHAKESKTDIGPAGGAPPKDGRWKGPRGDEPEPPARRRGPEPPAQPGPPPPRAAEPPRRSEPMRGPAEPMRGPDAPRGPVEPPRGPAAPPSGGHRRADDPRNDEATGS